MRYRLRTLLLVLAIAPPVLAGLWFAPTWLARIPIDGDVGQGLLAALFIAVAVALYLAFAFAVGLAIAWVFNTLSGFIAKIAKRK